ncbi:MAG: hypothetical protein GY755_23345 [Chloroflexi bacterium]|nr:hypothetical protein [Chloroflexota bacterium]
MTNKTFSASEIRPKIAKVLIGKYDLERILADHDISCLQLEIDIAAAIRPMFGGSPKSERGQRGDIFDFIKEQAKHDSTLAGLVDMREKIEKSLRKNITDWERGEWAGFDRWLVAREKDGETIEEFMAWWVDDDFRAKQGTVYLNAKKIKENWLQVSFSSSKEKAVANKSGGYR